MQGVSFLIMKLKRGTVREDGMIFWSYISKGNEWWMSESEYNEYRLKTNKQCKIKKKLYYAEYSKKNKEKIRLKNQKYRRENKEKVRNWKSNVYALNAERMKAYQRKWAKENAAKVRERQRKYSAKRKKEDPLYKLKCNIRNLILQSFKNQCYKKTSKICNILGCSFEEFKTHIESQFLPGMSWENRGEWHIDHVMPASMAKTYDEMVRLNHYKNLRPMWARDNLSKANKTPDTLVLF